MKVKCVIVIASLLLSSSKAVKFSLPLFQEPNPSYSRARKAEESSVRFQTQGDAQKKDYHHHWSSFGTPMLGEHGDPYLFTTNISIGTPPQPFRVIFDINWAESFVPSANCDSDVCKRFGYDSSESSTYAENGTRTDMFYPPVDADGRISSDILTLGEHLKFPLDFVELEHYDYAYADDEELALFDGVLGLAIDREWASTNYGLPDRIPSCFRQMVQAGVLDANVVSVLWPRSPSEVGDITFGGYDKRLFEGELVAHPLFPENTTLWTIAVDSMYMKMPHGPCVAQLAKRSSESQWAAQLMSRSPYITVPVEMAAAFRTSIHWIWSRCSKRFVVDCDSISELPELTFTLRGQSVTVKGTDYVEKVKPADYYCVDPPEECHVVVSQTPDVPGYIDPGQILLGTAFLKKVYTTFNWDERTVSIGKLAHN